MNNTLKIILIALGVLVVSGGLFFAGVFFWRSQYGFWGTPMMNYGWNHNQPGFGYGPMGGRGYGFNNRQPGYNYGPMMGNRGYGYVPGYSGNRSVQPLTVDEAKQAAQKYVDSTGVSGLSLGEVMIFNNNAYVVVKETATAMGAFELLVDPVSKLAYPEPGPNMMWNQKYGGLNHAGMMGGRGGWMMGQNWFGAVPSNVPADMPVTTDQAIRNAQAFLDQYQPGAVAATDPAKFYGYYTLDFSKDGKVVGMLSVNGYSGQVFLHTWHGTFIEEAQ